MCSEWVTYAGQLLHAAGYLHSDPTGTYDEDFAAAVHAFQAAQGITYEPDQVGPFTWAALGVTDSNSESTQVDQEYAAVGYDYTSRQGNYWHDEDTIHQGSDRGATAVDPGLEVTAGGKRYVIFTDEVRQGGSVAWKARNPGNIRNGDHYGAYPGKKVHAGASGEFAVFPDEETGFEAIKSVLRGFGHVTVSRAMGRYAPAGDGANDPDAYARSVAKRMGVTVSTYVDELTDDQMTVFAEAIKQVEGWNPGNTFALDDPALPAEVQRAIRGY
jgi:peptidoglycan hydrolase-like protein with peptidoglycan-binding domain